MGRPGMLSETTKFIGLEVKDETAGTRQSSGADRINVCASRSHNSTSDTPESCHKQERPSVLGLVLQKFLLNWGTISSSWLVLSSE